MKRSLAAVALGAVLAVALPAPAAFACSPSVPSLFLDRDRVERGGRLGVRGDGVGTWQGHLGNECPTDDDVVSATTVPFTATREPAPGPPLPTVPAVTLPPLRHVAYEAGRPPVVVTMVGADGHRYRVGTAVAQPRQPVAGAPGAYRHTFRTTVTVPAGLPLGHYAVEAEQGEARYGGAGVDVVAHPLASTGGGTSWLAATALLTAAATVATLRRRAA